MKVLFLDIDGVLNSVQWFRSRGKATAAHGHPGSDRYMAGRQLDPRAVGMVWEVVRRTGCRVVLSSTWRNAYGLERTNELLRLAGAGFECADQTPDRARPVGLVYEGARRGTEVKQWLDQHSEVTRFAIVDDDSDMGPLRDRLVLTPNATGIQPVHVEALVGMLGRRVG